MTAIKETKDGQDIKALIQAFFDRVNDSDPKGLQKLFEPRANLTIMRQDPPRNPGDESKWSALPLPPPSTSSSSSSSVDAEDSLSVVLRISIEAFTKLLEDGEKKRKGKPGPTVHEVPDLQATDVRVDGLMAMAWSPFRVTFDGVLHHYGTFVYTFGRAGVREEWRIEDLTQSYRRTEGWEEQSELVKGNL